jgi:importin subunit beta-1
VLLVELLQDPSQSPQNRTLAGILLKNTFVARDVQKKEFLINRWRSSPPELRANIKSKVVSILASPSKEARNIASLIVAQIAAIELERGEWMELIPQLLENVSKTPDGGLRSSGLDTLAFIAQEVPEQLQGYAINIMNLIAACLSESESTSVRSSAMRALSECLEIVGDLMAEPSSRRIIMMMILNTAQATDLEMKTNGLIALVKVAGLYYQCLAEYLEQIFNVRT